MLTRPKLIDTTLREGLQRPGVSLTIAQSVEIASALIRFGVDAIECSNPAISELERRRIRAVAGVAATAGVPLMTHIRTRYEDAQVALDCGVSWLGVFMGINECSLRSRTPSLSLPELWEHLERIIELANANNIKIRFTIEDSSRTPLDQLIDSYRRAAECGVSAICFADTTGVMEPSQISVCCNAIVAGVPGTELEIHCHDDRGLAVANMLAGVDAGAHRLSVSVLGVGERCGIASLESVAANLHHRGVRKIQDGDALRHLCDLVGMYFRVSNNSGPVSGHYAFTHTARLHKRSVGRDERAYSWASPQTFGRITELAGETAQFQDPVNLILSARQIQAEGPGNNRPGHGIGHVMLDQQRVPYCRQYCVAYEIPLANDAIPSFVEEHVHKVDSLFVFLGHQPELAGLQVEVCLNGVTRRIESPAAVFIPAGWQHSYRILKGAGMFVDHVLSGDYNSSLLE